ncbi:MAG: hypothetical protein ACUVV0_12540 [Anaerolineae bacterium]
MDRNGEIGENFIILASEVGQYVYCARAWWLARAQGYASSNVMEMEAGQVEHSHHTRAALGYKRWQSYARLLWVAAAGVGLLLLWLVLTGH